MYCSVCYIELRREREPFLACADCDDHFHYECVEAETLSAFFKAMVEQGRWYCVNCAGDSDSTREELQRFVCSVPANHFQPPTNPSLEEAAEAAEALETLDEPGSSLMDKDSQAESTEVEIEEEKDTEEEVVEIEGEKEAVLEDEPEVDPGYADD